MSEAERRLKDGLKMASELGARDRRSVASALSKEVRANSILSDFVQRLARSPGGSALIPATFGAQSTVRRPARRQAPRVFISHSHEDKRFVRSLAARLRRNRIKVWIDEAEIQHGDSLIEKLRAAIDRVDILLAVISPASIRSRWVQKEIDIAMNQEIKRRKVKVIPVLRKSCKLPGFLEGKLYADFTNSYRQQKNYPKLVESIRAHRR